MLPPLLSGGSVLAPRIERVVTSGIHVVDDTTWTVENNVWLVGDDEHVLVIDAAHDADAILAAIGEREVNAIACTHGHDDHVSAALAVSDAVDAPVLLHPQDLDLWSATHAGRRPDGDLVQGELLCVARLPVRIMDTPGHTPGSVSLYVPELECVFTGDALLADVHGATPRAHDDDAARLRSVGDQLLTLPLRTRILPGHGNCTTVRAEVPGFRKRIARQR